MFNSFKCAGCDDEFTDGQYYWEFYDDNGDLFYLDEFCKDAYLLDQRKQFIPVDYSAEEL